MLKLLVLFRLQGPLKKASVSGGNLIRRTGWRYFLLAELKKSEQNWIAILPSGRTNESEQIETSN